MTRAFHQSPRQPRDHYPSDHRQDLTKTTTTTTTKKKPADLLGDFLKQRTQRGWKLPALNSSEQLVSFLFKQLAQEERQALLLGMDVVELNWVISCCADA